MTPTPASLLEVIFDSDCGFCRACVRWIERHDDSGRITTTASTHCTWPDRDDMPFATTVVARDESGHTYFASSAVAAILVRLPSIWATLGRLVLRVNQIGFFARINDGVYYFVANHRGGVSRFLRFLGVLRDDRASSDQP